MLHAHDLDEESGREVTLSPYHSPQQRVGVEILERKAGNHAFSGKSSSYARIQSDSRCDVDELAQTEANGKGNVIDLSHKSRYLWIHRLSTATSKRPRLFGASVIFVVFVIPCIIVIIILSHHASTSAYNSSPYESFSMTTQSTNGLIATDTQQCSQIGADILSKGGNAVDAAIAASFCLGVISPASSGIGGGCFILIYNQTSHYSEFIDSREVAPKAATQDMFNSDVLLAQDGGLAIAVPGEVRGLYLAYQRHSSGHISWADLIAPAATLAEHWIISSYVGNLIQTSLKPHIESGLFPEISKLYRAPNGQIKRTGDSVQQPTLAHTLRMIGEVGPDYLYVTMASTLAAEIQAAGGIITTDDIAAFHPTVMPALKANISGYQYLGVGGSSSGGAVVAGLLKYMFSFVEPLNTLGNIYYHRLLEGMKHVFAVRLSLGDPQYVNTTAPLDALLSDAYMSSLAALRTSDHHTQPLDTYGGMFNMSYANKVDHGTSHISVLDSHGLAVAMTTTVNTYFGSKVISPSTGLLFNNEMDDFSIPNALNYFGLASSPLNFIAPGKKPLSSMSPSMLLDKYGNIRLVGGASGGPRIITATAQTILNYIGRGMDIVSAVTAPRVHNQLVGTEDLEAQSLIIGGSIVMPDSIWKLLQSTCQQNLTAQTGSMGVAQFISVDPDTGIRTAVSDPRKNGRPAVQKH